MHPTDVTNQAALGLSSCARAASAAESRFRIGAPLETRAGRVIALDPNAAEITRSVAGQDWASARFLVCESSPDRGNVDPQAASVLLRDLAGAPVPLADELLGAHVVVMIATEDSGAAGAYSIGLACWERSIMTAGVVLGDGHEATRAVAALRPHARVLLPSADRTDVVELLTALRV